MTISLGEFQRRHGVNKGTVSKKAGELGINTSNGLNDADYQAMKDLFNVDAPVEAPQNVGQIIPMCSGGLVPVVAGGITRRTQVFDVEQYQADKAHLGVAATATAADINAMVTAYAQNRIAGVLADIDLTADSIRANAMQAMGAEPGKPQAESAA